MLVIPTGPAGTLPWPGGESEPETRRPPVANVSYACAMSKGVTPWRRPPSGSAKLCEIGVRMPIERASAATRLGLTFIPTCTYTELSEYVVADRNVVIPAYASL